MKIAGIIAEYNPFHNGHLYHLEEARRRTGCDAVVAVMSGCFVQRGGPALFDKWARAAMALEAGVDAVFELPTFYALQSAEWFAYGGVAVLAALGADALCFGAEQADMALLRRLAAAWEREPEAVSAAVRRALAEGKSHPRARADALREHLAAVPGAEAALSSPNTVLAAMYLRWLERLGSPMEPVAIERVGAGYHDESFAGPLASATAIRRDIARGGAAWKGAVPPPVLTRMEAEFADGRPVTPEYFARMLLYRVRGGAPLPDRAEGLDRRMARAAACSGTLEEFYAAAKCKRYTMARIKRATMQTLLGVTAEDVEGLRAARPVHARLLGYSRRAEGLVGELARRATVPLIARPAQYRPEERWQRRLWELDLWASDVYSLAQGKPSGRDFSEKLILR